MLTRVSSLYQSVWMLFNWFQIFKMVLYSPCSTLGLPLTLSTSSFVDFSLQFVTPNLLNKWLLMNGEGQHVWRLPRRLV